MRGYLLDTNIVSELRKGGRAHPGVRTWFNSIPDEEMFVSVLVLGEIRNGVERIRRSDPAQARVLETWLKGLEAAYADRILPIDTSIADRWGRLSAAHTVSVVDGLMAATAMENDLTLVTRNVDDVAKTGVKYFNPF